MEPVDPDSNRNLVSEGPPQTTEGNVILAGLFGKGDDTARKAGDIALTILAETDVSTVFRLRRVSYRVMRAIDGNHLVWQRVCAVFFSDELAVLNRQPRVLNHQPRLEEPWKAVFDRLAETFIRPIEDVAERLSNREGTVYDYLDEIRAGIWEAAQAGLEQVIFNWFDMLSYQDPALDIAFPLLELSPPHPPLHPVSLLEQAFAYQHPHILWALIDIDHPHATDEERDILAYNAWENYVADCNAMLMFKKIGLQPGAQELKNVMIDHNALLPEQFDWMMGQGIIDPNDDETFNGFTLASVVSMSTNPDHLKHLLERDVDLHRRNERPVIAQDDEVQFWGEDSTCLHVAAWLGNLESITLLARADRGLVAVRSRHGLTAFHVATLYRRFEALKLLVELGADPNAKTKTGYTSLHLAVLMEAVDVVKTLLECLADVNVPSPRRGRTALNLAAREALATVVDHLLNRGALPHIPDNQLVTPLHHAARGHTNTYWQMTTSLLAAGASPNALSEEGFTPFHNAILTGDPVMVRLFLDRESEGIEAVNLRIPTRLGRFPFALAARSGSEELLEFFASRGMVDPHATSEGSLTSLHFVAADRSDIGFEAARLLLEAGASPNVLSEEEGYTPFHRAILSDNLKMVQLFLDHESRGTEAVNLQIPTRSGRLPFALAALSNSKELLKFFASRAMVDPHAMSEDHLTSLHFVAADRSDIGFEAARLLIEAGANPNVMSRLGFTPFHLAILSGNHALVDLFLNPTSVSAHHVDHTVCTDEEHPRTPLQLAEGLPEDVKPQMVALIKGTGETAGNTNN